MILMNEFWQSFTGKFVLYFFAIVFVFFTIFLCLFVCLLESGDDGGLQVKPETFVVVETNIDWLDWIGCVRSTNHIACRQCSFNSVPIPSFSLLFHFSHHAWSISAPVPLRLQVKKNLCHNLKIKSKVLNNLWMISCVSRKSILKNLQIFILF